MEGCTCSPLVAPAQLSNAPPTDRVLVVLTPDEDRELTLRIAGHHLAVCAAQVRELTARLEAEPLALRAR